jgi:hypothetical protein
MNSGYYKFVENKNFGVDKNKTILNIIGTGDEENREKRRKKAKFQ